VHYQYRHRLDSDDYYPELDEEGKRILAAAFAVADEAHRGISRNKIVPTVDYISHPIMTCDILYRMGERDPPLLASALLHDALEEGSQFEAQPEKMRIQLMRALAEQFRARLQGQGHYPGLPQQIGNWTNEIMDLCYEATKPEFLPEGKEVEQIERVAAMSLPGKKLKIADQAASLACNLTVANDPAGFPVEKERGFMEKALSLVIAIVQSAADKQEAESLAPWESFFGRMMLQAQELFEFPAHATPAEISRHREPLREAFDWDRLFTSLTPVSIMPRVEKDAVVPVDLELKRMDGSDRHIGLARAYLNGQGEVSSYIIWNDRGAPQANAIGAMQEQLTESLRKARRMSSHPSGMEEQVVHGILHPGESFYAVDRDDGTHMGTGRLYHLFPPLKAEVFVGAARTVDACSWEDTIVMISRAEELRHQSAAVPVMPVAPAPPAQESEGAARARRMPSWVGQTVVRPRFTDKGKI